MIRTIRRYAEWLHTRWPAGTVEKLPAVNPDGTTTVPGVRIVGDLTGIPLLKFSSDSGARAVHAILAEPAFRGSRARDPETLDLAIIGAGISGVSAAIEARRAGLRYRIFEASEPFSTIVNFPKGKPIYTYPTGMKPAGGLQLEARVKEALLEELKAQQREAEIEVTIARIAHVEGRDGDILLHDGSGRVIARARRAIVAIGRSGNHRKLGIPGEELDKVYNRLHDPRDFCGKQALVVGGGDSALETAIALSGCGSHVTLSYRKTAFSRPKPENIAGLRKLERDPEAPVMVEEPTSERVTTSAGPFARAEDTPSGSLHLALGTQVVRIGSGEAVLRGPAGEEQVLKNDVVFSMIGREAPLEFFRRSRISIRGELTRRNLLMFALFTLFCVFLFNWKSGGDLNRWFRAHEYFPYNMPGLLELAGDSLAAAVANPETFPGTLAVSMGTPGFYYSLAYSMLVIFFGVRRVRRRPMPYIRRQTLALAAIQVLPLFLLPQLLLPWAGYNGFFDHGLARTVADNLFPVVGAGAGREYWRAYGLILAWPLFIWNVFSAQPLWWWLAISFVQTFLLIPLIIFYWGKGAYCGWICSCGALAETLGDEYRHKMPHGPLWNRMNMVGQGILLSALVLLAARVLSWGWPATLAGRWASNLYAGLLAGWAPLGIQLNYYHVVDIFLAGIVGVGCYFWFSGRVWCRFACPLAALMHVYARFSRFRIFAEKSRCISCNVCTAVCHQGIDIMNFANKGIPMADPECVRCSACVQDCPTGTLSFGRFAGDGAARLDRVPASPVQLREL